MTLRFIVCVLALAGIASTARADICRVTTDGPGIGDWSTATGLFAALENPSCTEIWMAAGVYRPAVSSPTARFEISGTRQLYGGFAGTETERDQRDWVANRTIFSGDLAGDDTTVDDVVQNAADIVGTNSRNLLTVYGGPVLDGFIITGADGGADGAGFGGGIYCYGALASGCTPTLRNLVISGNRALAGGGLYNMGQGGGANASPILSHVVFTGNHAADGAAMYNAGMSNGHSDPVMEHVVFGNNMADSRGGAIFNFGNASPLIRFATFSGNTATGKFGGHGWGGAMFSDSDSGNTSPVVSNATFVDNHALQGYGGAVVSRVSATGGVVSPRFLNVTFARNGALIGGHVMYLHRGAGSGDPVLRNVIVWDNGEGGPSWPVLFRSTDDTPVSADHVVTQADCTAAGCTNVITADPLLDPLSDNGGFVPTMLPGSSGSAIDTGDDAICAGEHVGGVDARGVERPQGSGCDMGAVEWSLDDLPSGEIIFRDGFEAEGPTLTALAAG